MAHFLTEPPSPASPVREEHVVFTTLSTATSQASVIPSSASPLPTNYSSPQQDPLPTESTPPAHVMGKRQLFPITVTSPELVIGQSFSEEDYEFEAENQTTTRFNVLLRRLLVNQQRMMDQANKTNRLLQQLVQNQSGYDGSSEVETRANPDTKRSPAALVQHNPKQHNSKQQLI